MLKNYLGGEVNKTLNKSFVAYIDMLGYCSLIDAIGEDEKSHK